MFSDPRIIATLTNDFIPVTGDTHEIQNRRSPTQQWFLKMAEKVNPRIKNDITAQGFYVAAADGTAYAFSNNRKPEMALGMLNKGVSQFKQSPPPAVTISNDEKNSTFTRPPDGSTSILRIFSRIPQLPADVSILNHSVGRDHIWLLRSEVREILQSATEVNKKVPLPATLTHRLVRFHLVDNVRGEPDFWKPEEISKATFELSLLKRDATKATFSLRGLFEQATSDQKRGIIGLLQGEFVVDTASEKVSRFRGFAESKAWGAGTYTPSPPPGRFILRFAILETSDPHSKIVPPQGLLAGDEYLKGKL